MKNSNETLLAVTHKLLDYCKANDFAGYDPYDALNSKIFKSLPFLDFRFFRLGLTQLLKRSPINFRSLLLIPKTENPKAIALFLMAFLKLRKMGFLENDDLIHLMIQKLINLRSPFNSINLINPINPINGNNRANQSTNQPNNPYWCWGYSFPWQTRMLLVPRGAANLVCTTFVANSLIDAYERLEEPRLLEMAVSSAEYILNELYWESGDSVAGFSYPLPGLETRVHNANFLGAAILCKAYNSTGEKKFLSPALKAARYSVAEQRDDGSWDYAESAKYRWIDNFHTGYNLGALRTISRCTGSAEFEPHIRRGYEFYRAHFFRDDGVPKYLHNRTYPIDIHSAAQSIITLLEFKDLDENNVSLAHSVFKWAMDHMWDEKGYFYYQVKPYYKNRISYMRWSQAWMIYALAEINSQILN